MSSTRPGTDDAPVAVGAAEADLAEQARDVSETDLDPQAPAAASSAPSAAALDVGAANEADLAEQAVDVTGEDDEDRG